MSPLIEPWMLAVLTGASGTGLGIIVQRLLNARRMAAVHRGAYVEQMRHAAEMHRLSDEHAETLATRAASLTDQLNASHERELDEQLAEQARSLRAMHAEALAEQRHEAQARWDGLMHAHQFLRLQAQQALQSATDQMAAYLQARPAVATVVVEALPRPAEPSIDVAALQRELAEARAALDAAQSQRDTASAQLAQVMAQAGQRQIEREADDAARLRALEVVDDMAVRLREREDDLEAARREAALLREQLDATLVEVSALTRARDAREAQRAQLAAQLALAQDVRERESRIAAEQRTQLMQQLMQMKDAVTRRATDFDAERDQLNGQLIASRRMTRSAVLAARQREERLAAELAALRAQTHVDEVGAAASA